MEIIEIEKDTKIPFNWMHDEWGRAEFSLCPIWKRGKLIELWIYPHQQEMKDKCWHIKGSFVNLDITGYEGLSQPNVWLVTYCKEHKTNNIRLYVPNGAKYLWIHPLSGLTIGFTETDF